MRNICHIIPCLSTSEIAVTANTIVIKLWICLHQKSFLYVVIPHFRVFMIFLGKRYRIENVAYSGIIGCQNKF